MCFGSKGKRSKQPIREQTRFFQLANEKWPHIELYQILHFKPTSRIWVRDYHFPRSTHVKIKIKYKKNLAFCAVMSKIFPGNRKNNVKISVADRIL